MQFELLSPQLLAEFKTKKISTSTVIDILDGLNAGDALTPEIYAINMSEHYLVAQAYTVCWKMVRKGSDILQPQPSTWSQVSPFLVPELHSGTGLVYVAGAGPLITNAALAGGMSCTYFDQMGFAGVILGARCATCESWNCLRCRYWPAIPFPPIPRGRIG